MPLRVSGRVQWWEERSLVKTIRRGIRVEEMETITPEFRAGSVFFREEWVKNCVIWRTLSWRYAQSTKAHLKRTCQHSHVLLRRMIHDIYLWGPEYTVNKLKLSWVVNILLKLGRPTSVEGSKQSEIMQQYWERNLQEETSVCVTACHLQAASQQIYLCAGYCSKRSEIPEAPVSSAKQKESEVGKLQANITAALNMGAQTTENTMGMLVFWYPGSFNSEKIGKERTWPVVLPWPFVIDPFGEVTEKRDAREDGK